jgi:hypothetical protein
MPEFVKHFSLATVLLLALTATARADAGSPLPFLVGGACVVIAAIAFVATLVTLGIWLLRRNPDERRHQQFVEPDEHDDASDPDGE